MGIKFHKDGCLLSPLETAVWCALGRTSPANALTPKPSTLPLQWPLLLRLRHRCMLVATWCQTLLFVVHDLLVVIAVSSNGGVPLCFWRQRGDWAVAP